MSAVLVAPCRFDSMNSRLPIPFPLSGKRDFFPRSGLASRVNTEASVTTSLDTVFPAGVWPFGSLIEIFVDDPGDVGLELLLPLMTKLTRSHRRVAIIAPPFALNLSTLKAADVSLDHLVQIDADNAESHWSAEQSLRAGACAAVVQWLPQADYRQLRRLQVAAEANSALALVFRPAHAINQVSPAAFQLKMSRTESSCEIEIIKQRGRRNLQLNRWAHVSNVASVWHVPLRGKLSPNASDQGE